MMIASLKNTLKSFFNPSRDCQLCASLSQEICNNQLTLNNLKEKVNNLTVMLQKISDAQLNGYEPVYGEKPKPKKKKK